MLARSISPRKNWLATLGFCVGLLLVFFFILFDVLDVDGSDFPHSMTRRPSIYAIQAEAVYDVRRAFVAGPHLPEILPPTSIAGPVFVRFELRVPLRQAFLGVHSKHMFRRALPRASLADHPAVS